MIYEVTESFGNGGFNIAFKSQFFGQKIKYGGSVNMDMNGLRL